MLMYLSTTEQKTCTVNGHSPQETCAHPENVNQRTHSSMSLLILRLRQSTPDVICKLDLYTCRSEFMSDSLHSWRDVG